MPKRRASDDPRHDKKKVKITHEEEDSISVLRSESEIVNVDSSISELEVAFAVTDENLSLLLSKVPGCTFLRFFESITEKQLVIIAEKLTELETLEIMPSRWVENEPDAIDLKAEDLGDFCFAKLKQLKFIAKGLKTIHFVKENFPKLENLHVEQPSLYWQRNFHLDLPELTELTMIFVDVEDTSDFGPSLSRSPKLKKVKTYKLWGLGHYKNTHIVKCPNLEHMELYRSDDLNKLTVRSPVLTELNLRSNYNIETINVYPKDGTMYKLNIKNVLQEEEVKIFGRINGNFAGSRCDLTNSVISENDNDLNRELWSDWLQKKWNLIIYKILPVAYLDVMYSGKDSSGEKIMIQQISSTGMSREKAKDFAKNIFGEI